MDSMPSTSGNCPSPPKKRGVNLGRHLSSNEKQFIINMYKQIKIDDPGMKITAMVAKIKQATGKFFRIPIVKIKDLLSNVLILGVANSTIYRTIKEYKQTGTVRCPKNISGRPAVLSRYDEKVKTSVRQIVHSFFFKNEMPTLNKILSEFNNRPDLPNMCRSTLYKFLKQINFKYLKRSRRSHLIERDDIIRWRRRYLTSIKEYRSQGKPIYYLDETWVNEGHTKEKVWVDTDIKNRRQAFIEGLSTGLKNPSGKGKRLIVLHIGSELGFVNEGLLLFEGRKTEDYHEEMNASVFENWFSNILQKLPKNAVIVMDNAAYHSRKLEKIPTTSSKKKDMQEWLKVKNIPFNLEMVRSELLHLIRLNKNEYNMYVTDEMAKENGQIVLRLPPYHCELNPIEKIWAQVKNEVALKNTTYKLKEVKNLLLQALDNVTPTHWQNCVKHILKVEEKMCKLDGIMDSVIEPLIISIGNDDSDTSSSEDE
ncbi:uncharacterized protein LOC126883468 [Diabrotica virgifera virgifera]|uniref:Tc1-like transposase DDE domain-containing protein n=1 Tax=Diabrotica virgifera virgifera TaxID=50390 RepID=A0ABM5K467_DIAVI|nr:uncharacterized protein LOC126883468 [Diabrotica virgifera virgifera]